MDEERGNGGLSIWFKLDHHHKKKCVPPTIVIYHKMDEDEDKVYVYHQIDNTQVSLFLRPYIFTSNELCVLEISMTTRDSCETCDPCEKHPS